MRTLLYLIFFLLIANSSFAQKLTETSIDEQTYTIFIAGKYQETIKLGTKSLRQNIDFYYLRYRLGVSYFELNNYEKAIYHLEKAKAFDSNDPYLMEYLYYAYIYTNQTEKAYQLTAIFPDELKAKVNHKTPLFKSVAFETGLLQTNDLNNLKKIPDHIQIEVCLPMHKDVFDVTEIDSIFLHKAMILIQETFPGKSITIIRPSDLMSRANFRGQVLFDLAPDNYFVSDNFMHYLVAGRGGTVNLMPQTKPKDAFFTIPLSLYHKLHLAPLPEIESRFESLLNYSRDSKHINPLCDPVFQNIMRGIL